MNYHTPLLAGQFYHLFNRAIGKEQLFLSADNYVYFLGKLKQHILPVANVFAYSLMPNHFHLLVKIETENELIKYFKFKKGQPFDPLLHSLPDFTMEQFSNCFNAYVKAFNKLYKRKGSLFIDYVKRSEAARDSDITSFIFYIHKNAVHHGLTEKIGQWPYDSYRAILSNQATALKRKEVIEWFGSYKQFIDFHNQPVGLKADFEIDL